MAAAAAALNVTRQSLYNLAKRDAQMGAQMDAAREEGKRRRRELQHGHETCYVENKCRRPECVQAATAARADRRRRATAAAARPSVYELADTVGEFPERQAPGLADTA
jgi:hypothetical protein